MDTATNGSALMKVDHDDGLVMHCSPAEAQRRVQELQAFVKANMVNGVDYGVIPGTPKPSLWQPGAQKLCELYGIAHDFTEVETVQDWDKGFFLYRKRCVLTMRRNGLFAGAGIGSCNSREDRYAWRWVDAKQVPSNLDKKTLVTKETKWGVKYRTPNSDIYSLVNTIEKMACKRALVHAVIGVTRSAGIFTQDVEDLPAEAFGQVSDVRQWERDEVVDGEIVDKSAALIVEFKEQIGKADNLIALKKIGEQIGKQPEAVRAALKEAYGVRSKQLKQAPKDEEMPPHDEERQVGEEG